MFHLPPKPASLPSLIALALTVPLAGQALDLPASSGHVAVPASSALVPQAGITIEAWVQPAALGIGRPTIVRKNPAAFAETYNFRIEFDRPQFIVVGTQGSHRLWPTTTIPTNAPSHLAATYDGSTSKLYLNGVEIASATHNSGPLLDTGGELRIGRGDDVSGGETFTGQIDAVRIWDRALPPRSIGGGLDRELPAGQGLVASWNFDNNLLDETGVHHGAAVGSTGFAPEPVAFATGIDLPPSGGGFIEVADAPDLVPSMGLTMEAWIVLRSAVGRPTIVRKDPTPFGESYIFRVEFGAPQLIIVTASGTYTLWALGTSVPLNVPVHLAATYNGVEMALYMDGGRIDSAPAARGAIQPSSGPLRIGRGDDLPNSGGERFDGKIDSVRLWSVGLSDADIAYLRDRDVAGLPGLIASWDFDGDLRDSTGHHDGTAQGGTVSYVEQFGNQTGTLDTGVSSFGSPSSTCVNKPRMFATTPPEVGNTAFSFGSTGGPPGALWLHALSAGRMATGLSVEGVTVWIDPSVPFASLFGIAGAGGESRQTLAIPPSTVFIGSTVFAQAFWNDPCGSRGYTATGGLRFRVQY